MPTATADTTTVRSGPDRDGRPSALRFVPCQCREDRSGRRDDEQPDRRARRALSPIIDAASPRRHDPAGPGASAACCRGRQGDRTVAPTRSATSPTTEAIGRARPLGGQEAPRARRRYRGHVSQGAAGEGRHQHGDGDGDGSTPSRPTRPSGAPRRWPPSRSRESTGASTRGRRTHGSPEREHEPVSPARTEDQCEARARSLPRPPPLGECRRIDGEGHRPTSVTALWPTRTTDIELRSAAPSTARSGR